MTGATHSAEAGPYTPPGRGRRTHVRAPGHAVERARGHRRPVASVKPRLRGWLHAGTCPVRRGVAGHRAGGALAASAAEVAASAVYAVSAVLLFGVSAVYHRGTWGPRTHGRPEAAGPLQHLPDHRRDLHAVRACCCSRAVSGSLLLVVWTGALLGVVLPGASGSARPRWLYAPAYVALGWVAVFFMPAVHGGGGVAVLMLIAIGGAALHPRRDRLRHPPPDPFPTLVRLPRGLPRPDPDGVHPAVRRRLTGRLLQLTPVPGGQASGPSARTFDTCSMAARSSPSHSSVLRPTSLTHQASASERDRATPASTSVSSTSRSA